MKKLLLPDKHTRNLILHGWLIYLLLLFAFYANAQISKKQMFYALASQTGGSAINNASFTFDIIQYTDEPITLSASVPATLVSQSWEIRRMSDDVLVGLAFTANASITTVTNAGWYYVVYTARSATDQYIKRWDDIRVDPPRFEENEADVVVDLASGNYYNDFGEADNSGLKILVKITGGTATGQFQVVGLFGTEGDPVRIQKSNDNTDITLTCPDGTPHAIYLYGNNEWITFNGFNADKTIGWNVVGDDNNSAQVISASGGAFTGIQYFGMGVSHYTTINAAAFSFIANTDATTNASTYVGEQLVVWGCTITDAGEEGVYMGYNSDVLIGGYRPVKFYDCIIAWNVIDGTGRDGIQPGGLGVRIHNNTISDWGLQHDTSHESAVSWNSGTFGTCYENYCVGGEMFLNIQSGAKPMNLDLGETAPRKSAFYSNVFDNGTYTAGGSTESFNVYIQNSGSETTASTNWPVEIYNNTVIGDKKFFEAYFHASSWTWTNHKQVNNLVVKVGTAGDTDESNYTGPGTQPTGTTQNNLVRNDGSESDILFTNYAGGDYTISSLSSPVYTGATDVSTYDGDYGVDGLPLNSGGFAYGAYSGYQKKTITPAAGDPDPASFTSALAIGTLTQSGGTITFEANKVGVLFWAITANNATAPTEAQLRAGGFGLASGQILDAGTAGSYVVSILGEGTAYDLHGIFVTEDDIPQASVTKVDFTTTADTTAPTVVSMTIADANRDKIVIVFTESVTGTNAGFTIAGTTSTSFSSISGTGTNTITGTMAVAATYGQSVTLAYSSGTGDLRDLAVSPNDLATFGATAVTNNIAVAPQEDVVWVDMVNATASGDDITASGAATGRSDQIIPAASNGYITWDWDNDTRDGTYNTVIGIVEASAARTKANTFIWIQLESANFNINTLEGTTYKNAYGYRQVDPPTNNTVVYRIRLDRATGRAYAESSINGAAFTTHDTSDASLPASDYRFVFIGTSGKQCINAKIQADLVLN